jgi:hypothetical protein
VREEELFHAYRGLAIRPTPGAVKCAVESCLTMIPTNRRLCRFHQQKT